MKAAVLHKTDAPLPALTIEDVDIDKPTRARCSSAPSPPASATATSTSSRAVDRCPTPAVLGHEAAGIVEAVGDDVTYVKPGDHVIACLSVFCGALRAVPQRPPEPLHQPGDRRARPATAAAPDAGRASRSHQFANISSFAEKMLLHENAVVKIRDDMPLDRAALIGCGVTTGVGAALNTARVEPGSTVAVFGAGGVGLCGDPGRAHRRRAPDHRRRHRREQARDGEGARRDPRRRRVRRTTRSQAIRDMTGGGVDYSFEAIGLKTTARAGVRDALRPAARRRSSA